MRLQNVVLEQVYGKHKRRKQKYERINGMTVKQLVVWEYIKIHGPCAWSTLPWRGCMTLRNLKAMGKLVFEKTDGGYVWRVA
jgi:hypothetical protein